MRILIVDDHENVRTIVRRILERDGHDVRTATDGRDVQGLVET